MRREPIVLVSATRDDLTGLASLHRLAFEPTKIMRYLHTDVDPDVFTEFFVKRFTKVMDEAEEKKDGGSVITVAKRGGKPLGFAWTTREPAAKDRPAEEKEKPERPLMAGADPVRSRELLGALDRHAKNVPFPHWSQSRFSFALTSAHLLTSYSAGYLDLHILSIDPAAQGAGVGKRLLQSAIDLAVAENLPLTLESTECEQYLRLGSHVTHVSELMRRFSLSSWSAAVSLVRL